ncbi:MAG: hypothetical protein HND53_03155 [Proteobacteria bacterium]|nr:hypothetical protein [Pseudomonadota bacterium]NOG59470.1 hypothetical protein [Pseudomonadota bacterium]
MGVYSVDKLIAETRRIAKEYRLATGKTLPVTPEIAINDAISILGLLPSEEKNTGYDAIYEKDGERLRIQIKGRAIFDDKKGGYRIGQVKTEQEWDAIVLVIMNGDFLPEEIYIARRDVILNELEEKKKNNKKGAMTLAKFKLISELLWTEQNGFEQFEL